MVSIRIQHHHQHHHQQVEGVCFAHNAGKDVPFCDETELNFQLNIFSAHFL